MDVDSFISAHEAGWRRLDELTARAQRKPGQLSPGELDELVERYQRVSTHLSLARTTFRSPELAGSLSERVAHAGAVIYAARVPSWRRIGGFFTASFPGALWSIRWFVAVSAAIFLLPAAGMGLWIAGSQAALEAAAPEEVRQAYVSEDFESYYSSQPAGQFAANITTNNIQVSFFAFAGGILFCLPTAGVLAFNGANVGFAAGLFAAAGEQARFWGLILPHGLLELTGVFIAGGTGLRLGWTLIDPGDRWRGAALTEEARRAVVVVIGLVLVFTTAGFIEGFITGSTLPTPVRVGVGALAWLGFLAYVTVCGRRALAEEAAEAASDQQPSAVTGARSL
jgi:uncharacterized membrane protein SpoIIM required for sporulation